MQSRATTKPASIASPAPVRRVTQSLCERSGRTLLLRFEDDAEALEVRAPDGTLELTIRLTAEGPILQVRSARVELVGTRAVEVKCERFEVAASEDVAIHAGRAIELEARLGDISVTANDDVVVAGERIYLNP
jgi:hypothetical protein